MPIPLEAQTIADDVDLALSSPNTELGGKTFLEFLASQQELYLASNGQYFQGLALLDAVPEDGNGGMPDPSASPEDQTASWADVLPPSALPAELLSRPAIDVYEFPNGDKAYSLRLDFISQGVQYRKTVGCDGHSWMEIS